MENNGPQRQAAPPMPAGLQPHATEIMPRRSQETPAVTSSESPAKPASGTMFTGLGGSGESAKGGRNLELDIGELVLHGFPEHMRERLGTAIHRELNRLLAQDDALGRNIGARDLLEIEGGAFTVQSGVPPEVAGREIARAIARGMKGG